MRQYGTDPGAYQKGVMGTTVCGQSSAAFPAAVVSTYIGAGSHDRKMFTPMDMVMTGDSRFYQSLLIRL